MKPCIGAWRCCIPWGNDTKRGSRPRMQDRAPCCLAWRPSRSSCKSDPAIVTRAKRALLDDVRKLVLLGVQPRPDGLHINPTAASLAIAEQLISSLPDDVAMPSVSLPDDGEITFSWQTMDETGERWRAVLAIAPDSEVECFVRRSRDQKPTVHFQEEGGAAPFGLPSQVLSALRSHWRV